MWYVVACGSILPPPDCPPGHTIVMLMIEKICLKDTSQFRKARHDIARLRTVLRQRQLAAELAQQEASNA